MNMPSTFLEAVYNYVELQESWKQQLTAEINNLNDRARGTYEETKQTKEIEQDLLAAIARFNLNDNKRKFLLGNQIRPAVKTILADLNSKQSCIDQVVSAANAIQNDHHTYYEYSDATPLKDRSIEVIRGIEINFAKKPNRPGLHLISLPDTAYIELNKLSLLLGLHGDPQELGYAVLTLLADKPDLACEWLHPVYWEKSLRSFLINNLFTNDHFSSPLFYFHKKEFLKDPDFMEIPLPGKELKNTTLISLAHSLKTLSENIWHYNIPSAQHLKSIIKSLAPLYAQHAEDFEEIMAKENTPQATQNAISFMLAEIGYTPQVSEVSLPNDTLEAINDIRTNMYFYLVNAEYQKFFEQLFGFTRKELDDLNCSATCIPYKQLFEGYFTLMCQRVLERYLAFDTSNPYTTQFAQTVEMTKQQLGFNHHSGFLVDPFRICWYIMSGTTEMPDSSLIKKPKLTPKTYRQIFAQMHPSPTNLQEVQFFAFDDIIDLSTLDHPEPLK